MPTLVTRGADEHEAQDLTQEFFATLIERRYLAGVDPDRGRFRTYLLAIFKNFLTNQWHKSTAQKRGGGRQLISLDFGDAESRVGIEPLDDWTPEREFERQWATTIVENTVGFLKNEMARRGKGDQYEFVKGFIGGSNSSQAYKTVASEMGISEGALRVLIHRLRRRYRELLRNEIAQTLSDPERVDDEIRSLFAALGG